MTSSATTTMTSPESLTTWSVSIILLFLPLINSSITYKDLVNKGGSQSILPWHRIPDCPNDLENFIRDSSCQLRYGSDGVLRDECSGFTQYCFNKTMSISCTKYSRDCDVEKNSCSETYEGCTVSNHTNEETFKPKAIGIPQPFYAECIPALDALRDQCVVSRLDSCKTTYVVNPDIDSLESCNIDCREYHMQCYNYTRSCASESSRVVNTPTTKTSKIDAYMTDCALTTLERRLDEHAVWNGTVVRVEMDSEGKEVEIPRGSVIIERFEYYEWDKESSWESCTEAAYVPYQPMCNQFIRHIMGPLNDAIFEPHAYDLNEGVKMFLSRWDGGWEILCRYRCFFQLIKFSRTCWPKIPLQRFLPGVDYNTLENLLKNMTRIACYQVPSLKLVDEPWLNSRNSCVVFFDPDHNVTRPYYQLFEENCGAETTDLCSPRCTEALDAISQRFGCCLGSIKNEYNFSSIWYEHFNFRDNPILKRINTCNVPVVTACETIFVTSLTVSVFRNFIYVVGGVMCIVIVVMTVSFYWQLEHEPIKKRFYHF